MKKLGIDDFSVEDIYKGLGSQRSLSDMCVVTLPSNSCRESTLRSIEKKTGDFKGPAPNDLKFDRAKTLSQLNRNNALRKASDALKKVVDASSVEILWRKEGSKHREVLINNQSVFRQEIDDILGQFLNPYKTS